MNMQIIGKFIQESRQKLNLSQQDLGDYLSVTNKAVSKWERGLACPDIENLKNMAGLFRCTISDILEGSLPGQICSSNIPVNFTVAERVAESPNVDVSVTLDYMISQSISPLLFGDNLEHTRSCIYGGLSAEILRNRKFVGLPDRYGCALEWYAIGEPAMSFQSGGVYSTIGMPYTRHAEGWQKNHRCEQNAQYITNHKPEKVGIGQKDLYLQPNAYYQFEIAVKASVETVLTVALMSHDRIVYDCQTLVVHTGDYTEEKLIFHTSCEDKEARLEVTFDNIGTIMIGAISLMPVNNFRGMRPDVIEKMKELGIKLLRWPGGNFAGDYNWKDGLLPRNMRAPYQSHLWYETQAQSYGYDFNELNTDDFLALCHEIGAEPFLTINPVWNTPEECAQWVEYCNGDITTPYGQLRAKNGHPEPYNVHFWSLGNEMGFSHMEGAHTPEGYAKMIRPHALKMLEVSSGLTLCSSGPYPDQDWVDKAAKELSDISPVISLHHYANYPLFIEPENKKEEYEDFVDKVDSEFEVCMQMLREQLGDSSVRISYDEWNSWFVWHRMGSVAEGIMAAAYLNMLFRNADKYGVMMACYFESVNEGAIQVFPDCVKLSAIGQVFSLMKVHANGMVCALEKDIIATYSHSVVTSTLLNRSYDKPKKFTLANCGDVISAELYSSEDVVQGTKFEISSPMVSCVDGTVEIILPPHSIASIRTHLPN